MNIYLIGFRGTGKTTVGRLLARKLGWNFIDTDGHIMKAEGRSVARIVKENGWKTFREMERQLMDSLSRQEDTIVSTGSGWVLDPIHVETMRRSGRTVWLRASAEVIYQRVASASTAGREGSAAAEGGLLEGIAKTLESRGPIYRGASDMEIDTGDLAPEAVVSRILGGLL